MKAVFTGLVTILALLALGLTGCSKSSNEGGDKAGQDKPSNEKAFDGKFENFQVQFMSAITGPLRRQAHLGYKFEVRSNELNKGTFVIYDCRDESCALRSVLYKASCSFNILTCQVTDSEGQKVAKGTRIPSGGSYQMDAADLGDLAIARNCDRTYKECAYLTLIDPMLRPEGFYDQYFAAEFVPAAGPKSELKIFRLTTNRLGSN